MRCSTLDQYKPNPCASISCSVKTRDNANVNYEGDVQLRRYLNVYLYSVINNNNVLFRNVSLSMLSYCLCIVRGYLYLR